MIPFLDLKIVNKPYEAELRQAFDDLINSGWYVLGKKLEQFEQAYANETRVKFCAGVSNGLDALHLCLRALGVGQGDEVIVPSNTFIATVLAVSYVGATPVFAEPDKRSYNIDPAEIEKKVTTKTRAIIPVHLFGHACEMDEIMRIAKHHNLYVVEDNAQAHLATYNGAVTGSFGNLNATSFYPGKNLGALGDGGAVTTNDEGLFSIVRNLRNYGSDKKYYHDHIGFNMRLDELQAALLHVKLKHLPNDTEKRQKAASIYNQMLSGVGDVLTPFVTDKATHVYHLYVIRTSKRDALQQFLKEKNIQTLIHYPIPPHLQKAYSSLGYRLGDFPIAEELALTSLSLPMWSEMPTKTIEEVADSIRDFYA